MLLSAAPLNLVLLDSSLVDTTTLRQALSPGAQVIAYNARTQTASQVLDSAVQSAVLQGSRIGSITLLSHGREGAFALGSDQISASSLDWTVPAWRNLATHLAPHASIYIYSCSVVQEGGSGQGLIDRLSNLTGAGVYASSDITGKGGDWQLEAHSLGARPMMNSPLNAAALANYQGQLAVGIFKNSQDIGSPAVSGSSSSSGGTYTIKGAGSDIWGSADQFQYAYLSCAGNSSISARVTAVQNTATYAKGGLMWRDSTAANAAYAIVAYEPSGRVTFEYRSSNGANAASVAAVGSVSTPIWVRLTRSGAGNNVFTAYYSTDGSTWTSIGSTNVTMGSTALVGLAVTSKNTSTLNTSTFDNVSMSGPTVATPASATPSPVTGTSTALSVLGADPMGESTIAYTWSATGKPAGSSPSFSANGTNAAKDTTVTFDKAGTYTFLVTLDDGTATTTSSVTVVVSQTLTSIAVSPSSAALNENATQQFAATGYDQFGAAMASQPTITWSVLSGVGSIGASGLYAAPGSPGSATVKAASGAVSGTASVTVTNAAPTVATPASASPATVTGTTTALSVLGSDDGGESNLTYTWSLTSQPASSNPAFSINGTHAAKNTTVTFDRSGSYTFLVTISDGSLSTTSSVTVLVSQTLTSIVVSPSSASLNENAIRQFTATGYDQFGIALAVQPGITWSKVSGVGSIDASGLYTAPYGTGTATIRAASGGIGGTATVTVNNAAPTVVTPASANPQTVTGTSSFLSVLAADDGGESNLVYTWSLSGQPGGSNPVFSINGSNAAKSTTVTFDRAGTYNFVVTISDGAQSVTSAATVTVSQTITSIVVTPGTASLVENAAQQFSASARDQFGLAMAVQPAFTWSKVGGVGAIDASGLYTAPSSPGSATIQAASGAITGTAAITVTNAAPTVVTPASVSPATPPFTSRSLSVLGADDGGEGNLTYTWSVTSQPASSHPLFSINGTNAAKESVVTFDAAGSYTFLVTISDGTNSTTSSVNVIIDQAFTSIGISPGSASLHENGTQQFVATAYDQFGAAMVGQPSFTWSKVSGVGGIDASGFYTAPYGTGTATVQAASGGISATASITITNAAPSVATPAFATPAPVLGTGTVLSVLGADDGGENNLTYTWSLTSQPGSSNPVFSINGTHAAGTTGVTFDRAGTYTFLVTIDDGSSSTTSSVTVTVAQTLTSISLSPGSASLAENATQQFAATGYDQFGVIMAVQPSWTWSLTAGVGSVSSGGLYTAPYGTGSATVQAASGSIVGSAAVTVANAAPTVATPAGYNSTTATSTALGVLGADDGGENNLIYTWSVMSHPASSNPLFSLNGSNAAKNTEVSFDRAGTYTFLVTIDDGSLTTTSSVTVTVAQSLTSIAVSPSSASLNENAGRQLSATAYDQFGLAMAVQPGFSWSITSGLGSIDATGFYTAPGSAGSATAQASSGAVSGSAAITIVNAAPTIATPANFTQTSPTRVDLSVLGADDGGEAALVYTWSITAQPFGSAPAFSSNGANAPKNTTVTFDQGGSYTFLVTVSDGNSTATDSITVVVDQVLTTIAVTPGSSSVNLNQSQQLTANGFDQFGDPLTVQPAFTWSLDGGSVGGIDAGGLFSAGGASGSAVARASAGGLSGTATVVVGNGVPSIVTPAYSDGATPTSVALHIVADDDGGEAGLTYTWTLSSQPPSSSPAFSINGTNAAKNTTVTFNRWGSYTFLVTVSDGVSFTTSTVTVAVSQTATTIQVTPGSAALQENQAQSFTAMAYDQFGVAMAAQPSFTWSKVSGVGAIDATGHYTAPYGTGTATIQASGAGVSGTASITVTNAAPTVATPASATPSSVTGTSTALAVLGADDGGEGNLVYTWTLTSQPLSSNPAFSANGTNAAKNTTVTFDAAGSYTFLVTIGDGSLSTTSSVTVTVAQTLTSIAVSPPSAGLHENATQQFAATGFDQFGSPLAVQPAFAWSKVSGIGSIDASGLYTAPYATGTATVRAASGGIAGTATVTVTNAAPTVATPASANPQLVTGQSSVLSVLGADDGGETNLTYTWSLTGQPASSNPVFSTNGTNAAKSTSVTFDRAGTYTFLVTIGDGALATSSSVTVTVAQTLSSIVVSPGSASLNENGTQQFSAIGYDQFGLAMTAQPSFTWSKATGVGAIDGSGLYTAPGGAGTATITAARGAISGSAAIAVTNAAPTVSTSAFANPSPVNGTTTTLAVLGADDGGESGLTYTWSITSQPASSNPAFSINGSNAAKDAVVTFDRAGTYTFLVTISDGSLATTSSVTVVVNQTLSSIVITPGSVSLNENATRQFSAVGYDQFGLTMTSQPGFTWSKVSGVGSIDSSGLYTAPYGTGTATVQAASGGISGTAGVTVTNAAPVITAGPAFVPAGPTGITLNVLAADDGGAANLTYTWSLTSQPASSNPVFSTNGTNAARDTAVSFDRAGTYTFAVSISDDTLVTTGSVTVTVAQVLTSITVNPPSASLNENATCQFGATGYDQFGIAMASQPSFGWSRIAGVGAVDATGLYTAPYGTGSATVQAANGAIAGSATISVTNAAPTVAAPASADSSTVGGLTVDLSALGADDGGESNLTYTWTLIDQPASSQPAFSINGTNTAKNTRVTFDRAGSYDFLVTISDGALTTTSSVTVTVDQTPTSIVISPPGASLNENGSAQFSAIARDQFGIALAAQPAFTWTLAAGIGSVDALGLYRAPAAAGTATIQASAGAIAATAAITIINAPPTLVTPATASPSPVTGTAAALSVLGSDDGAALTYTWSIVNAPAASNPQFSGNGDAAARSTTVTFDKSGTYRFAVAISDGTESIVTTVDVTVAQTLTTMSIAPATATLHLNDSCALAATAYDQFGQPLNSQPAFAWSLDPGSVGTVDSGGIFRSSSQAGTAVIRAAAGGVSASASIQVLDQPPRWVAPASATDTLVTGTATTLYAVAQDDGGATGLVYTWTLQDAPAGAAPTFSVNGSAAASNTLVTFDRAGAYVFVVTVSDGSSTISSPISLQVVQTLSIIQLSPGGQTLQPGQSLQLSAATLDQFGSPVADPPTLTWSTTANNTVDSSGLFVAHGPGDNATVTATAGGVHGSVAIRLLYPAPPPPSPASDPVSPPAPPQVPAYTPPAEMPDVPIAPSPTTEAPAKPKSEIISAPVGPGPTGGGPDPATPPAAPAPTPPQPAPAAPAAPPPGSQESALPAKSGAPANAAPASDQQERTLRRGDAAIDSARTGEPLPRPTEHAAGPRNLSPVPGVAAAPGGGSGGAPAPRPVPVPLHELVKSDAPIQVMPVSGDELAQSAESVEKAAAQQQHEKVVRRVVGSFVSASAAVSAGYILWLARGGSLLLSMLAAAPMWRYLDPLPILDAAKARTRRRKRKVRQAPAAISEDDRVENLLD